MVNITSLDLYKAKEICLNLQNSCDRLILKGNSPILLTTNVLKENVENSQNIHNFIAASANSIDNSYLDALIFCLNHKLGVHGIIDYSPSEEDIINILEQISANRLYFDKELKRYLENNNIQALFSTKLGNTTANEDIIITEKISSFSFMGMTGITKELSNRLKKVGISNHIAFGGAIDNKLFHELGYDFTDDTIAYNNILNIGTVKGKALNSDKIWPRTVELAIKQEDDTYNLEKLSHILIEYFDWIEIELKEESVKKSV